MIGGPIEQLYDALLIYASEDERGAYYCGCQYVSGVVNCPHHGDPVEIFPRRQVEKA